MKAYSGKHFENCQGQGYDMSQDHFCSSRREITELKSFSL